MYWLQKFTRKRIQLRDYMPFGRLFNDNIIVDKDGSLQAAFRYRGADLDSATLAELASLTQRLNHGLLPFGSGWVAYGEAQRQKSREYETDVHFTDKVTRAIDEERKAFFSSGAHYESSYYFTLFWMPPSDTTGKLKDMLIEGKEQRKVHYGEHLEFFMDGVSKFFELLKELLPEVKELAGEEYLTYLHSLVSPHRHKIQAPKNNQLLDTLLCDSALLGGLEPMLGKYHLRVVVPLKFTSFSMFGMFNAINRFDFECRWITKYILLDKQDAISETRTSHQLWKGKMKTLYGLVKEMITGVDGSAEINENALHKAEEAREAMRSTDADEVSYGFYSSMIVILDRDRNIADQKARLVEQALGKMGLTATVETLNAVDAWLGSIPGNVCNHVRRPLISTGNLVHMLPLSDIWAGPERNEHLGGPVLLYTQTEGNTPFRLDFHVRDVGHTFLVGPIGTGKSVHLCLVMAQFRKYRNARIFAFDKGGSMRVLTYGVGGNFFDLGSELKGELSFQPLAKINDENERAWAAEWIYDWLRANNFVGGVTPEVKIEVWAALTSLAGMPVEYRNITGLVGLLQKPDVKTALYDLTEKGPYGRIFDSTVDTFSDSTWQVFEMEKLWGMKAIIGPLLMYLFHKIDQRLDYSPTLITLDECWALLDDAVFSQKIKSWIKELRKYNAFVVFATQDLTDLANSPIVDTIQGNCPTKIFLPNSNAVNPKSAAVYERFGLNMTEIGLVATGTPKRHYYYKSELGSRLYELQMGQEALDFCAATSKEDQKRAIDIIAEYGKGQFADRWREYKRSLRIKDTESQDETA